MTPRQILMYLPAADRRTRKFASLEAALEFRARRRLSCP